MGISDYGESIHTIKEEQMGETTSNVFVSSDGLSDEQLRLESYRLALEKTAINQQDRVKNHAEAIFEYVKYGAEGPINWDSNLVKHAHHELTYLGEDKDTVHGYLRMITVFSEMGHSGGSASVFIPTLNELLQFHNLKPLTNRADEWMFVGHDPETSDSQGKPVYQSRRRPDAFSNDRGRTYYMLDEPRQDGSRIMHTAEDWENSDVDVADTPDS